VVGFEFKDEAERFWSELKERMQKFQLELHPVDLVLAGAVQRRQDVVEGNGGIDDDTRPLGWVVQDGKAD